MAGYLSRHVGSGKSIQVGGLTQAESFNRLLDADAILMCDVSSSMTRCDAGEEGQQSRYDVMVEVVRDLMDRMEGKLAVIAFGDEAKLVVEEMPPPVGITNMVAAFNMAIPLSGTLRKVVIVSDGGPTQGSPTPESATLEAAKQIECPIDSVFIGTDRHGEKFMSALARANGGRASANDLRDPVLLTNELQLLLAG